MKFTTPCFVYVKDAKKREELIEWLAQIGYRLTYLTLNDNLDCIVTGADAARSTNMERFDFWITSVPYVGRIDCGNNIELFKALAARNDENDRKQWFINDNYADAGCVMWHLCDEEKFKHYYIEWEDGETDIRSQFRKATAAEIVEHFKNK